MKSNYETYKLSDDDVFADRMNTVLDWIASVSWWIGLDLEKWAHGHLWANPCLYCDLVGGNNNRD